MVDVRIKFSLARFDYSSLYSIPRSPKDLYIAQSLYTQTLRFDSTEKLYFLFFAEREPPVDQLITDFPNRPNMSTPHIQDLADSADSTASGSSVPSDPVNFEMG